MKSCVTLYQDIVGPKVPLRHASTPFLEETVDLRQLDQEGTGVLGGVAAKILMKILYGARAARWDLLKTSSILASRLTKWTKACDKALHLLASYMFWTWDTVLEGYVRDQQLDLY